MKVTYIGDPLDNYEGPAVITYFGEVFEKGKAKTIPDDHPNAEQIKNNPTFAIGADKAVKDAKAADAAREGDPDAGQSGQQPVG